MRKKESTPTTDKLEDATKEAKKKDATKVLISTRRVYIIVAEDLDSFNDRIIQAQLHNEKFIKCKDKNGELIYINIDHITAYAATYSANNSDDFYTA